MPSLFPGRTCPPFTSHAPQQLIHLPPLPGLLSSYRQKFNWCSLSLSLNWCSLSQGELPPPFTFYAPQQFIYIYPLSGLLSHCRKVNRCSLSLFPGKTFPHSLSSNWTAEEDTCIHPAKELSSLTHSLIHPPIPPPSSYLGWAPPRLV